MGWFSAAARSLVYGKVKSPGPANDREREIWRDGHEQGWNDCVAEWERQNLSNGLLLPVLPDDVTLETLALNCDGYGYLATVRMPKTKVMGSGSTPRAAVLNALDRFGN